MQHAINESNLVEGEIVEVRRPIKEQTMGLKVTKR